MEPSSTRTGPSPRTSNDRFTWRRLIVVFVGAAIVRAAFLGVLADHLDTDPDHYLQLARNVVEFGTLGSGDEPTAYRPPLYPMLLVPGVALGGGATKAAIFLLHVVLGAATVATVDLLGIRWRLGRWGLLAVLLVAFDPMLVHQSSLVMTETLATLLATASLVTLARYSAAPSASNAAAAGLVLGLAALARPTFLPMLALVAVCLLFFDRRRGHWSLRMGHALALLAAAALLLAPWAARNARQLGYPTVSTTHGGYTLWLANNARFYEFLRSSPRGAVWEADEFNADAAAKREPHDEIGNDRRLSAAAVAAIREEPGMFLKACVFRLRRFWGVAPRETRAGDATIPNWLRYAVTAWYAAVHVLALAGFIALCRSPGAAGWAWGIALAMSFSAVHLLYWSDMRMRAPLIPWVALLAAAGAAAFVEHRAGRASC